MAYKLSFYVPSENLESVKEAIFLTGGGQLGQYQECCWQTEGIGQFKPLLGANPHKGEVMSLSRDVEYKVEIHCSDACIKQAVKALKEAHPYEVVAYDVIKLEAI